MKDKHDKETIDMFDNEKEDKVCIVRMVRTPDNIILHSKYRHDCVGHTDKDGVYYQLDGGIEGFGSCCNLDKCENRNLYYGDDHTLIREHFVWGRSFDKDMNPVPFEWVKLKDMTDAHLEAVMDLTCNYGKKEIHLVIKDEWIFRKDNNIKIEE